MKNTFLIFAAWLISMATIGQTANKTALSPIKSIEVSGSCQIELKEGEEGIAMADGSLSASNYSFSDGKLRIFPGASSHNNTFTVWIVSEHFSALSCRGNSMVVSHETIYSRVLRLRADGRSSIRLHLESEYVQATAKAQAHIVLQGFAKKINAKTNQQAKLNIADLEYDRSYLIVNQQTQVDERKDTVYQSSGKHHSYVVTNKDDEAHIKLGELAVDVDGDSEQSRIRMGSHEWMIDEDGVEHKRYKRQGFTGHWKGLGIGINGYLNKDWGFELAPKDSYMELLWNKSINIDINLLQYNMKLSEQHNFGLVTGLGFSINNYRFNKSFTVATDSSQFYGYINKDIAVQKSKLVLNYLQVPLLLELHDRNPSPLTRHRWHVSAGFIFGLRIHAHQKTVFNETGKAFELRDPEDGHLISTAHSPNNRKVKVHQNFDLQPFKADVAVGLGWGIINVYAHLSLNKMFQSADSPQLHPITIGLMLTKLY